MELTLDEVQHQVMQLSPEDQFDLYSRLGEKFDPVDDKAEAAWDAEILRRVNEVRNGKAVLFTMDEVNQKIDALRDRLRNPS